MTDWNQTGSAGVAYWRKRFAASPLDVARRVVATYGPALSPAARDTARAIAHDGQPIPPDLDAGACRYTAALAHLARNEEPALPVYTLQQHKTTGDIHALRYEGATITGISEAIGHHARATITAAILPRLDYGPYQGNPDGTGPDGFVVWHPPIITSEERS